MGPKDTLRDLMTLHEITAKDVSELLGVNPGTVYAWRTPKHPQIIPRHKLELLELKLQAKKAAV